MWNRLRQFRFGNPLIRKELIQAANSRKTFVCRAGLPLLVVVIMLPQLYSILSRFGQDWRAIADITRSIFQTVCWIEVIAFPLAAYVYAAVSVQSEWMNKTMETLCATPLSRLQIIYGKFAGVLSNLILLWLSILPIIGIWYYMGRIPKSIAIGSTLVIAGFAFFSGALGVYMSSRFRSPKAHVFAFLIIMLPLTLTLILCDAFIFPNHVLPEALLAPHALGSVLSGRVRPSLSVASFALLSAGLHVGLGLLLLGAAPFAFARSLRHELGGAAPSNGFLRRAWRRVSHARRKPMRQWEDPFRWREKGSPTLFLKWALWLVCAIIFVIAMAFAIDRNDYNFFTDDDFWAVVLALGVMTNMLAAGLYGALAFVSEKTHHRAAGLLLTGLPPQRFIWPKLIAGYRALLLPLLFLGIVGIGLMVNEMPLNDDEFAFSFFCGAGILVAPALWMIVGMVFSVVAKSTAQAVLGFFGSIVWAILFGFLGGTIIAMTHWYRNGEAMVILPGILFIVLLAAVRRWTPLMLGALFATCFYLWFTGMVACAEIVDRHEAMVAFFTGTVLAMLIMIGWYRMLLRFFENGLSGQPTRLWGRNRVR